MARSTIATTALLFFTALMMLNAGRVGAADGPTDDGGTLTTSFTYHAGTTDTPETARGLAIFGAKLAAAEQAAAALARKGLRRDDGERRMEILCLVADAASATIIDESVSGSDGGAFTLTVQSHITLADFVRAGIADAAFDREERHLSWQQEMEPTLPPDPAPGQALARVYRYIRRHHWRMAVIYLDHLSRQYPYWADPLLAKATAFQAMHETARAVQALKKACALGSAAACTRQRTLAGEE